VHRSEKDINETGTQVVRSHGTADDTGGGKGRQQNPFTRDSQLAATVNATHAAAVQVKNRYTTAVASHDMAHNVTHCRPTLRTSSVRYLSHGPTG